MSFVEIVAALLAGFLLLFFLTFIIKLPTNEEAGEELDAEDEGDDDASPTYDPAGPDPWEGELGDTTPRRDVETLIDVLRQGEPGPCRQAVTELVEHGAAALPALRAAAAEGDPDLKIDAERAIASIETEA